MQGPHVVRVGSLLLAAALVTACAQKPMDPVTALNGAGSPEQQMGAVEALNAKAALSEDEKRALRRTVFGQGVSLGVREAAFDLMVRTDRDGLRTTLETNIVRMESFEYRRWLLEQIAARGMKDFTVVVVNSWAGPVPVWGPDERKRPEFEAIAGLYGADRVGDALFAVMMEANPVRQSALRERTWELLMRIGER